MRVLITGASGYVGARILEDLSESHVVTGTFHNNKLRPKLLGLDIRDKKAVFEIVSKTKPDVIIHAAAIPSIKQCERAPQKAILTYVSGPRNIVDAANANEAMVFYLSSFGTLDPVTVYGKTKLEAEKHVMKSKTGYNILRLSVAYGVSPNTENDRPFNRILRTIREGKPLACDNIWKFSPTYLGHVSSTIQTLLSRGINGKAIGIAVPELKSMYQVASDILGAFGMKAQPTDLKLVTRRAEQVPLLKNHHGLPVCSYEKMVRAITKEISASGVLRKT